jgi:hypothetical protein
VETNSWREENKRYAASFWTNNPRKLIMAAVETSATTTPAKTVEGAPPDMTSLSSDDEIETGIQNTYNRAFATTPVPTLGGLNIADSSLDLPALPSPEVREVPQAQADPPNNPAPHLTSTRKIPDPDGFGPSMRNRRLSTDPAMRFRQIAAEWKSMAPVCC